MTRKSDRTIEECLFGPERRCPESVWDAILSPRDEQVQQRVPVEPPPQWKHAISIPELRRLASQGIGDAGSHRAVAWRVLLNVLPPNVSEWKESLLEQRTLYRNLVAELFVEPEHDGNELRGHHGKKQSKAKREFHQRMAAAAAATEEEEQNQEPLPESPTRQQEDHKAIRAVNVLRGDKQNGAESENQTSESQHDKITDQTDGETQLEPPRTPTNQKKLFVNWDGNEEQEVPPQIREQWRRSGRDANALESIRRQDSPMNTLLVMDNPPLTGDPSSARRDRVAANADPLGTETDNKWFQFFENASLLDEIRKDVVRTHPDLYFFLEPEENLGQRRYAAIERILFVWAKLNKGVRYVQGMNEIIGTLYYVLANDFNEEWACEAEADSYFLFNTLMSEMRDVFVPDLDEADTGIQGRISNMTSLLSLHDPEVRCHLVDIGIDSSFYAIRWLTTLLSREFLLPDTIRLWDSMFASTHKDNFLRYVCVTMVMIIRDELLKGDFSTCLRLLQSYPTTNVDGLLESSRALWIYESQVTLACHKGGISLHQALQTITPPPSIIMAYGLKGGMAKKSVGPDEGVDGGFVSSNNRPGFFNRGFLGGLGQQFGQVRSRPRPNTSS